MSDAAEPKSETFGAHEESRSLTRAPRARDLEAIATADRLAQFGFEVRSPELAEQAAHIQAFYARGGNRAMRRAAAKAARRNRS